MQGENPPRGGGQQPIRGEQPQTQTIIVNANTPWAQQLEIWMMPHGFLRAAATRNAHAEDADGRRQEVQRGALIGDNKAAVNGYINEQNLVERVETWIDNPFLGDMPFEAIYSDYKDVGGAKFPMHIVQKQGGYPIFDLTRHRREGRTRRSPFSRRRGAAARRQAGGGAAAADAAQSEKLADGVYLITGGYAASPSTSRITSRHRGRAERGARDCGHRRSEAADSRTSRSATSSTRTATSITRAACAPFVAEGATILTHQVNKAYLEKTVRRCRTRSTRTRLQQAKKKPIVETMSEKKVLTDGNHDDRAAPPARQRAPRRHDRRLSAEGEDSARGRRLQPAGAANAPPPNPPSPYTLSLVDNIQRLKLDVQRIVPVHYPADGRK